MPNVRFRSADTCVGEKYFSGSPWSKFSLKQVRTSLVLVSCLRHFTVGVR